jgi:hypothetical protein
VNCEISYGGYDNINGYGTIHCTSIAGATDDQQLYHYQLAQLRHINVECDPGFG